MEKNYSVYDHITPDGMHYYGTTNNIKERFRPSKYKTTSLRPYIEKYGWENIQHIVLFENQSKEDALSIEDSLIVSGWEKGNCINQQRSGYVTNEEDYNKQYYEDNKDKIKQYREDNKDKIKQYYQDNKDKIKEQSKQYYEDNKDKIKQYREDNKDKIKQYNRQRYQRKKEEKRFKELGYIPLF